MSPPSNTPASDVVERRKLIAADRQPRPREDRELVRRYDAVLFDLLTALVDSWTLWNSVASNPDDGRRWRGAYLRNTYAAGHYRPYERLVADAAEEVGLERSLADDLAARYGALQPWPEAPAVLNALGEVVPLGIVTNCSEKLGRIAASLTGANFAAIVTAEAAGFYKPHPRPYQMALDLLNVPAERCLFVAGSAYDLFGTAKLGLPTFWHDRVGMTPPADAPKPLWRESKLTPLVDLLGLVKDQASS
jgi:2-haloalkanoic acid dehalogenase type II